MQTHKNKVIETNNAKSHKQTHTHIHWSQNTDWDRAIQWEKERGKASSSVKNEALNDDHW